MAPAVVAEPDSKTRREKPVKGPPYLRLFLGLLVAFTGLHFANKLTMIIGGVIFAVALLIGYARAPAQPPLR